MHKEKTKARVENEDEIIKTAVGLFRPAWIPREPSLWPGVRRAMAAPAGEPAAGRESKGGVLFNSGPAWKWSVAAVSIGLISIGFALVGFRSRIDKPEAGATSALMAVDSGPRLEILSSVLAGAPAKTFLFQTRETSYVWLDPVEKAGRMK